MIRLKLNTVTQRSICRLHLETKPNRFASNILPQRVSTVVRLLRYHRIVYWNVLLTRKGVQKFPVDSSEQQSNLSDSVTNCQIADVTHVHVRHQILKTIPWYGTADGEVMNMTWAPNITKGEEVSHILYWRERPKVSEIHLVLFGMNASLSSLFAWHICQHFRPTAGSLIKKSVK